MHADLDEDRRRLEQLRAQRKRLDEEIDQLRASREQVAREVSEQQEKLERATQAVEEKRANHRQMNGTGTAAAECPLRPLSALIPSSRRRRRNARRALHEGAVCA